MKMADVSLYQALFDEAAEAIFLVNRQGEILLANRTSRQLFGYEPEELLGQTIEILVPARLRNAHSGHRSDYAHNPRRRPMGTGLQLWGLRKDGREFPVDITLSGHGNDGDTICVVRDVSERIAHEGFERAMLSATSCAIVLAGTDGLVRSWNRGAELLLGYAASEVIGKMHISAMCGAPGEEMHPGDRDAQLRCADGSLLPVRVSVTLLEQNGIRMGICCIAVDMREHEEARRTLRASYEARNRFFARASHELRTPLNAILGFGQLLAEHDGAALSLVGQQYLDRIRSGGERLLRLTNDLLELSRWEMGGQTLDLERFPLDAFLDETLADFRPAAEAQELRFAWRCPGGLELQADRLRLGQVLANLVANAMKFTPRGGKVSVEANEEEAEICLRVSDTGPGISGEALDNIFEEFYQIQGAGRAKNAGTGLGLPIARKLVEAHGGRLEVQSTLGQGSCFQVYLRRAANS
ncbi:MAG: PAS domain-containing sensor histidine kinase [Bryobacter sp.]|nr:PAS domain-containing sensor histidine kinase [Bryobacter sp.]